VEDPGKAAEITVAEIDEQRQEEADRANRLYDLPMDTDGPRFGEPVTDRFAPEIPDDIAVNLKEGEGEQIGQALVATRMERCRAVGWASRGIPDVAYKKASTSSSAFSRVSVG
jgi:hypothetical protein